VQTFVDNRNGPLYIGLKQNHNYSGTSNVIPKTAAVLCAVTIFSGCTSIVDGSTQTLSVQTTKGTSTLAGANCVLTNNKGTWFVTSPGTVAIHRAYDDLSVVCKKDGEEPGAMTIKSSAKGMAFGNIVAGGIIGAAIDMGTGAAYDYPSLITVSMGLTTIVTPPVPSQPAPGPTNVSAATTAAQTTATK
jgi:hypothetical protein